MKTEAASDVRRCPLKAPAEGVLRGAIGRAADITCQHKIFEATRPTVATIAERRDRRPERRAHDEPARSQLEILANPETLSPRVSAGMLELATSEAGVFAVARSGGSTSRRPYQHLPYRDRLPWALVLGRRALRATDDARSNYCIVRETSLSRADPRQYIHRRPLLSASSKPSTMGGTSTRRARSVMCLFSGWGLMAIWSRCSQERRRSQSVNRWPAAAGGAKSEVRRQPHVA